MSTRDTDPVLDSIVVFIFWTTPMPSSQIMSKCVLVRKIREGVVLAMESMEVRDP